jgi:hypothetical protein
MKASQTGNFLYDSVCPGDGGGNVENQAMTRKTCNRSLCNVFEMKLMLFVGCITSYKGFQLVVGIVMWCPVGSGLTSP